MVHIDESKNLTKFSLKQMMWWKTLFHKILIVNSLKLEVPEWSLPDSGVFSSVRRSLVRATKKMWSALSSIYQPQISNCVSLAYIWVSDMMNFTYSPSYQVQSRNLILVANLLPRAFSHIIKSENMFSTITSYF